MENKKTACDNEQCPNNQNGFCDKKQESLRETNARIIAIECKSFYRVFCDIESHILPFWEKFRKGELDEAAYEEEKLYQGPYIVNGAFAAELALKYLLELANIDYSKGNKGHKLKYLFDLLLLNKAEIRKDKDNIVDLLCKDGTQTLETLKINIEAWSDCYNRYRYLFSYNSAGTNGVFPVFVHTVCKYTISKFEELKEKDACEGEI